jgi:hypothetical protein
MAQERTKDTQATHESTTTEAKTAPPPATGSNHTKRLRKRREHATNMMNESIPYVNIY